MNAVFASSVVFRLAPIVDPVRILYVSSRAGCLLEQPLDQFFLMGDWLLILFITQDFRGCLGNLGTGVIRLYAFLSLRVVGGMISTEDEPLSGLQQAKRITGG
jgi:hypothetical protein